MATFAYSSDIAFTPAVKAVQARKGSRGAYAHVEQRGGWRTEIDEDLAGFLAETNSFYLATATADGQPYIQHRGGPAGFLKLLPENMLGFADYRGNRQFVSMANIAHEPRVALFLVDYPARRRLKLVGRARVVTAADDPALVSSLMPAGYRALAERVFLIDIVGFDWNCPKYITPRYTEAELNATVAPLQQRIAEMLPNPDVELTVVIPYDRGDLVSLLHDRGRIVETSYDEAGTRVHAFATPEIATLAATLAGCAWVPPPFTARKPSRSSALMAPAA